MAIIKMKRFSAITLINDQNKLIADLQKLRCIDVSAYPIAENDKLCLNYNTQDTAQLQKSIAVAADAISFLAGFQKKSRSPFSAPDEVLLDSLDKSFLKSVSSKVERAHFLSLEIPEKKSELSVIKNEILALTPWMHIELQLPEFSTGTTKSVAGTVSAKINLEEINHRLSQYACVINPVKKNETLIYLTLTAHKADFDKSYSALTEFGFIPCTVQAKESDDFASGKIKKLEDRMKDVSIRIDEMKAEAKKLSSSMKDFELYHDFLTTELARCNAKSKMALTERTAFLTGWVPERCIPSVTSLLDSQAFAYDFSDPRPEDDPPVALINNRFSTQFEPIIELYSPPVYGSFDPTVIMSFFYFIIFGLMLSDVGYGFLISLGSFAAVKLMHPKKSTQKMLTMFGLCGISCMIMGVLFGGYFSDLPQVMMQNWFGAVDTRELAVLFNPLTSPVLFLGVSLGVGAVHLITALCIKFYILWSNGKKADAVCDAGSWIVLFTGAAICLLHRGVGTATVLVGVAMLILTQGRAQKNIFMKLFKGIASLYDIVGYISDLLSYSRILALGLASMVIGSVFNILGTIPSFSFLGILLFTIIFTVGHLLNLAINLLGTFVHTARLQYIEFFGKFYEDGGRPFEPLSPHSKFVVFK